MIRITQKEDCCGCTACASACGTEAITMIPDEMGFVFPQVDAEKCVECGLCEKVCPLLHTPSLPHSSSQMVAHATSPGEQQSSAGGGLMAVFSRYIIEKLHGVVYGCSAEDCFHVRHIRVECTEDLAFIKGSKYVQSDMQGIFPQVKADLKADRYVLFTGTPCQVAGLRSYLRRNYPKLFCVDLICHGVPSQKMLTDTIEELKLPQKPDKIHFRIKRAGRGPIYGLHLYDEKGKTLYSKPYGKDEYITAFLYALDYRDSCYTCPFARKERVGDLTVGDYWDEEKAYRHMSGAAGGLSQLHVNTAQGEELMKLAAGLLSTSPISLEKLLAHSEQLSCPMPKHRQRSYFIQHYGEQGFRKASRKALNAQFRHLRWAPVTRMLFAIPGMRPTYFYLKKKLIK